MRWHFDFMGASRWFFSISGVILLVGALALATKQLNFGIDFESGTRIKVALVKPTDEEGVREALDSVGISGEEVQQVTDPNFGANVFQIQSHQLRPGEVKEAEQALDAEYGVVEDGFDSTSVGPTFGQQVANSALKALIFSLLVICGYVALRFDPKFAVPVLIAIFHDILITAGVYSLTGKEVSSGTVAAFLTILGYSIYDTIIVFDRIRENVPRMPRAAFSQIVNRSMSEVLTRSLATSFSTMLAVTSLLVFGGATLQDFAFAMLVGIASGTYSSIFIASPVLTAWKEREPGFVRRRLRIAEAEGSVPAFADDVEMAKLGGDDETEAEIAAELADQPEAQPQAGRRRHRRADRRGQRRRSGRQRRGRRRPRPSAASATPSATRPPPGSAANTGGSADGTARLVHDGDRPLALHRLPARSLLAGDRRRLPRLGDRRDRLRPDRRADQRQRPRRHRPRHRADRDPRRGDRPRRSSTRSASAPSAARLAALSACTFGALRAGLRRRRFLAWLCAGYPARRSPPSPIPTPTCGRSPTGSA